VNVTTIIDNLDGSREFFDFHYLDNIANATTFDDFAEEVF